MRMIKLAAFSLATGMLSAPAFADSCYDLWYARNAIFADAGYCFKTELGISTFGNDGCYTSNPRLTRRQQARVNRIIAEERYRGCKVN